MAQEREEAAQQRRKWTRAGLGVIVFGLVSATGIYLLEARSSDVFREEAAMEFAILYAALWVVLGLIVIRWFNRNAPDHANASGQAPHAAPPTKEQTWERRKGTLVGLAVIALGLASAIVMYLTDRSSFEFFKKTHAMTFAVLHAVLWGIVGVIMILWHNRQPPDSSNRGYDPNDPLR
jgi:presenilin-like A22 family membrane protease